MSITDCLPHAVIFFLLRLERLATEAIMTGDERRRPIGGIDRPPTDNCDEEAAPGEPHREHMTIYCPNRKYLRYLLNLLFLVVFVPIYAAYYVLHTIAQTKAAQAYYIWLVSECVSIPVLVSFPFAAPIHRALKGKSFNFQPELYESRLQALLDDPGTKKTIYAFLLVFLVNVVADATLFYSVYGTQSTSFDVVFYISLVVNQMTVFGALMNVIVAMRVILTRLFLIENDVQAALDQLEHPDTSYVALESDDLLSLKTRVEGWFRQYRDIWHDTQEINNHFGRRLYLGIFLLILVTSAIVPKGATNSASTAINNGETMLLLVLYSSNAIAVMMALYNMALLISECLFLLGPKVLMVSFQQDNIPECGRLGTAIFRSPIRLFVGNFDVNPTYVNTVSLWFIGLLVVFFGLQTPGG